MLLDRAFLQRLSRAAALFALAASAIGIAAVSVRLTNANSAPMGIVIVTLDTTRADRLSIYGYMNAAMPALERLAEEGVVFDQASATAPLTLPSHCSIFTGLLPPRHGVRDNAAAPLADTVPTLAEILQRRGFRTGAFVGSVVLDAGRGLARGFEEYRGVTPNPDTGSSPQQRRGDEVISDALHWLDGITDVPFFMWAHLYDPHRPYDPPEPYRSRFDDAYVGEIAFADAQIGRLMDDLARRKVLDRTIVVIAADHGESLGEHGERDHGIFVYENVLHVPLIVKVPNVPPGRVNDIVRLVDVMPTVLDFAGVPAPTADGVSLAGLMRGTTGHLDLEAYSESLYPRRFGWSPVRSLRAGRFKLIEAPRREMYDLEKDPFEQRNLYQDRRPLAALLERRLVTLEGGAPARQIAGDETVAPDLRRRLASLGYVASAAPVPEQIPGDLPDPKDCLSEAPTFRASASPACKRGDMVDDADGLEGKGRH
jgi:arylsulfatase A-like enzyme